MGRRPLSHRLICGVLLVFCLSLVFVFAVFSRDIAHENAFSQQNLIRFHVLANSNLPRDQDLKLLVRDAILAETRSLLDSKQGKEQAYQFLTDNQNIIREVAQEVIHAEGFDYPVAVSIGNFPFPERQYGSLKLPEGWYDAVRVEIGEAKGDNWWCVLFPPLCLTDIESADSALLSVNYESEENRVAFRWKLWDRFAQTQYAQAFQKWWQASAASHSLILE